MARRLRRDGGFSAGPSAPLWMLTYGDLVTQVLIFFVLLFTFSTIDAHKFEEAIASIQGSLGLLRGGRTLATEELVEEFRPPPQVDFRDLAQMRAVQARLEATLEEAQLQDTVILRLEERGLVVRFSDQVLFDLGQADIKPEGRQTLDRIAPDLAAIPNQVRVEGHTDNWPINTPRFPSNWELSAARATNVVRYLIEVHGLSPERLSAAGYGEYRPIAPNDSDANRQRNRRVDVVIMFLVVGESEPR